jgi:hypothetical protein
MLFSKLTLLSVLTALIAAQDISQDDIPQQCTAVCADVVSISRRCDDTTGTSKPRHAHLFFTQLTHHAKDNDAAELDCICRAPNAASLIPTCEACVANYDNDDTDPDDSSVDENGMSYSHSSLNASN